MLILLAEPMRENVPADRGALRRAALDQLTIRLAYSSAPVALAESDDHLAIQLRADRFVATPLQVT
jgi:hypothetical protein